MAIFYLLLAFLSVICWEEIAEEIFFHIFMASRLRMAIFYIFSLFLPEISWEEVAEETFFHIFVLLKMSVLEFKPWPHL